MGFSKQIVKEGDKKTFPQVGQTALVHYTGYLDEFGGKKFDTSVGRGQRPFPFRVGYGEVIQGWDESVPTMSLGEKAIVKITPDYAYGEDGVPPIIPSNATLVFEMELVGIKDD